MDTGDSVEAVSPEKGASAESEANYDSAMEEIKRKREERRKQQEEEEKKEEEERKKREEERLERKRERERKAKEREDSFQKELEEKQKRDQKEEERKKKKEERERIRLEEERKEKEEEEKRMREKAERRKSLEEQESEELLKRGAKREESSKWRAEQSSPAPAPIVRTTHEPTSYSGARGATLSRILEVVNTDHAEGHKGKVSTLLYDDDMREELLKHLTEEHPPLTEYFSNPEVLLLCVNYLTKIPPNAHTLDIHQVDSIVSHMEFARDIIAGSMPGLWKILLQPDYHHILDELFSLLHYDQPVLPLFHVNCFWKSVEFLIYRRGFEVSSFLYSRKATIVPSIFKHLRDSNVMDMVIKMVDNEAALPGFKEYNPRSDTDVASWCDDIPLNILTCIQKLDNETTDEEIDNLCVFVSQVLDKYHQCKLAYQLRDSSFTSALIHRTFFFTTTPTSIKHEGTLGNLLNFVTLLLKASVNTATYTADMLPPIVASMLPSTSRSHLANGHTESAIDILQRWLRTGSPLQKVTSQSLPSTFSVFRMKCLRCVEALTNTHFKCVDDTLQESGVLNVCVNLFFQYQDHNIVHCSVENIVRQLLLREMQNPGGTITQHILAQCNLVERIVDGLSVKKAITSAKGRLDASRIEPPPFSGHVMNMCKLLSQVAEKSFATRTLIAECSGYRWGQVVLFRLGMKESAERKWRAPMKKVDTTEVGVSGESGPVID